MTPQIQALLASVLSLAVDRCGVADRHAAFQDVLRLAANVQPKSAEPVGATKAGFALTAEKPRNNETEKFFARKNVTIAAWQGVENQDGAV